MALEIASFVIQVGERLWSSATGPVSNLVNYRKNIKNLNDEVEKLEIIRSDNRLSERAAQMNGEEIKGEVQMWLNKSDAVLRGVERLNGEVDMNRTCFGGCCPDWISRYKLSKQAKKDAHTVRELQGTGRFERVSLPGRRQLGIESTLSLGDFQAFESTKRAMDEVMVALKEDRVNIIGVYGMGGVGKTTMVKQVGANAHRDGLFQHVAMAVISQNPDLRKIQAQIADMLNLKLEEESEAGRAARLRERIMRGKSVLIILDDIWRRIDLSEIGIPSTGSDLDACKSKILLTTRLENVCHVMESQAKVPLNILSEQDSWTLFGRKAGRIVDSPDFHNVAQKIVKECGGLPIALVVVARALGDKDLDEWKEAARQLEMSKPTNLDDDGGVFKCIKLSYDYLKGNSTKPCFLICCLFPEDTDISIEDLVKYGLGQGLFQEANTIEEARGRARSVVKYLKACSLLLDSTEEGGVKMHDVVRDMAILLASSEEDNAFMVQSGSALKEWPTKDSYEAYTAISLMSNEIEELPDGLVCPKLQTLLLQNNNDIQEIPDDFFGSFHSLRVLDLNGADIPSLPPSLGLLRSLRTLCLDCCQSITDISILGKLEKLEILSLRESYIEDLPEELAQLANLRMLDFTMSNNIKSIPPKVISSLSRLEEMYMQGSFADWGLLLEGTSSGANAGFDELTCLHRLNILKVDISDAECMPKTVRFDPNWVNFDICISRKLFTRFMNVHLSRVTAARSRALILDVTINTLPDWFNKVATERTEKLYYIECRGLDNILMEYDQGSLNGLKILLVQGCHQIVHLMDAVTYVPNRPLFPSLEELRVHNLDYLKEICIGQLPPGSLGNMKFLQVEQCNELVNGLMPANLLRRLESLEVLDVSGSYLEDIFRTEGLREGEVVVGKLRELKLDNLPELKNIWNGPTQLAIFHNLKILTVIKCKKLRNLFTYSVAQSLRYLEELWIEYCNGLEGVIGMHEGGDVVERIIFQNLKNLSLQNLPVLRSFYEGDARIECPSLEQLHVQGCPTFRNYTPYFHSRNQFQVNNEQHLLLLRKRYGLVIMLDFFFPLNFPTFFSSYFLLFFVIRLWEQRTFLEENL